MRRGPAVLGRGYGDDAATAGAGAYGAAEHPRAFDSAPKHLKLCQDTLVQNPQTDVGRIRMRGGGVE